MTQRLLLIASRHWVTIDGEAAWRGVDLLTEPFDRFLNAVYRFATRDGDGMERQKFDNLLWVPPVGVVPDRGPWSAEAETSAFRAVKAALGMKDAPTGE